MPSVGDLRTPGAVSYSGDLYRHFDATAHGTFAPVAFGFLNEPLGVAQALAALSVRHSVALGLFVDAGERGEEDIPALLAPASARGAYAVKAAGVL